MERYFLQSVVNHEEIAYLNNSKSPHIVGRSSDALIKLMVRSASRQHALIQTNSDNQWTIYDNSANGVFVNGKQIPSKEQVVLNHGDLIQFGNMPMDNKVNLQYKFLQDGSRGSPRKRGHSSQESSQPPAESPSAKMKRVYEEFEQQKAEEVKVIEKKMEENLQQKEKELEELRQKLLDKDLEQQQNEEKMKEEIEKEKQKVSEEKEALHEALDEERRRLRSQLDNEKHELELRLREELASQLQEREHDLLAQLEANKTSYVSERERINHTLAEMSRRLEEKNERDEAEEGKLKEERARLDQMISQMEVEQRMLRAELDKCKGESERHAGDAALKMKENVLQCFADLAETELQCCICQELFIKAVTVSCSHSFCLHCITQWKAVQGKRECPVCRAVMTNQNRALVLDSYIDKMLEHMSDETREHRQQITKEREEIEKAAAVAAAAATPSPNRAARRGVGNARGRRAGRGAARGGPGGVRGRDAGIRGGGAADRGGGAADRGRGAGDRGRGGVGGAAAAAQRGGRGGGGGNNVRIVGEVAGPPIPPLFINLLDDDSMRGGVGGYSDTDSSDSEEIEGLPGVYYGGWGHCFTCGRRGHWANGCPF